FDAEKFVNALPAHRHDHFLIPGGTVHCSGKDCMVLEISATPYIFTFKLYDWGRVGLDGKPRPINIEHGSHNIQYDRTTSWCEEQLVNHMELLEATSHLRIERTGLHPLEFIETTRYWFDEEIEIETRESVNMLNLIEGEEVIITSVDESFDPYIIHYVETFIVPEGIKRFRIAPYGQSAGQKVALIQARVRV
ncbi:MAG: class I mannose-6-phosphate isomerase, partial [bacterium]